MNVRKTRKGGRVIEGRTQLLDFRIELDASAAGEAGNLLYITDARGNTVGEVVATFRQPGDVPPPAASDCTGCGS